MWQKGLHEHKALPANSGSILFPIGKCDPVVKRATRDAQTKGKTGSPLGTCQSRNRIDPDFTGCSLKMGAGMAPAHLLFQTMQTFLTLAGLPQ